MLQTLSTVGAQLSSSSQAPSAAIQKTLSVGGNIKKPNLRVVIPTTAEEPPPGYFPPHPADSGDHSQKHQDAVLGQKRSHSAMAKEGGTAPEREGPKLFAQESLHSFQNPGSISEQFMPLRMFPQGVKLEQLEATTDYRSLGGHPLLPSPRLPSFYPQKTAPSPLGKTFPFPVSSFFCLCLVWFGC